MLGKLIKHEWLATSKWLLPLNLVILLVTIVGKIILTTGLLENDALAVIAGLLLTMYILTILGIGLVTTIVIIVRFYKNMFSSEGYLTFTLPVKPVMLLNAKLIVSVLWGLINSFLTILSISVLVISKDTAPYISDMSEGLSSAIPEIFHMPVGAFMVVMFLFTVISEIFGILTIYCSISIGQQFQKHKIIASGVSYFIIYNIIQIISFIISMIISFKFMTDTEYYTTATDELEVVGNMYSTMLPAYMILFAVLSIIMYFVSKYFIENKLNLD